MPFQPAERGPDAERDLRRVVQVDTALRDHDAQRRSLVEARAAAITAARVQHVPLRDIAAALGVTPERVRQMEAGK